MKNPYIGDDWENVKKKIYTPEEIVESELRVQLIGELKRARDEKGISQRKLESLSGVKQPAIARIEKGKTSPTIGTVLKLLYPLGKKLAIVPLDESDKKNGSRRPKGIAKGAR